MIPGRILVVDDKKDEVSELVEEFHRRGDFAVYSGLPIENVYYRNTRLLILDYYLIEDSEKDSLAAISETVRSVFQNSKFFMLVIWSAKVTSSNRKEFKNKIVEEYEERFKAKIPCIILDPISKDELDYAKLVEKIDAEIANYPDLELLYEIEKAVDRAKDKVVTQVYDIGNWSNLVRSLTEEYDIDSVAREILVVYLNMLKRDLSSSEKLRNCMTRIIDATAVKPFDDASFGKIYSAQYYYEVAKGEQIGTGDILCSRKSGKFYIVITPECDITNDKHTATTLIESRRIEHSKLADPSYVQDIAGSYGLRESDGSVMSSKFVEALMKGTGLRANFCVLPFMKEGVEFYHLLFDFHKTKSVKKAKRLSDLKGYRRVCRVDSPMINRFLQQYSSQCSRFGTMTIPKEVLKSSISKLPRKIRQEDTA